MGVAGMTKEEGLERGIEDEVTAGVTVLVQIESGRGITAGVIVGAEVGAEAGPAAEAEAAAAAAAMTDMREFRMHLNMSVAHQDLTCLHPPRCHPCRQVQMWGRFPEMSHLQFSCRLLKIHCRLLLSLLQS